MLFGGGHLYVSANATAGFALDRVNPAFHADGDGPRRLSSAPRLLRDSTPACPFAGVYFTRLWNVPGDDDHALLTHQVVPTGNTRKDVWMAPIKQARGWSASHERE